MKNALSSGRILLFFSAAAVLTACGGGGGGGGTAQSLGGSLVPTAPSTTQPAASSGPVMYLRRVNAFSSAGNIVQGSQQAMVAVMSSAQASSGSFQPDTLSVSVPSGTSGSIRVASMRARSVPAPRVMPVEAFPADDGALLAKLRRFAVPAGARRAESMLQQSSTIPSQPVVGSTANIWVQQGAGNPNSVQVASTLVAQSAHGNIWLDDSLLQTSAGANASQIAADFENAYASDTAHFARPDYPASAPGLQAQFESCSSNGSGQGSASAYITEPADHRIDVMIVNPNRLGGFGGYFSASNFMQQTALNCLNGSGNTYESNEAPFIFVGWFDNQGSQYELQEDLVRGTAHELQHLINFVNHALLASGASNPGFATGESTYINEGLSMLAQDLAVRRMYGAQGVQFDVDDALQRADAYLADPGNFSISGFDGIDGSGWGGGGNPQFNCFGGCYGGAYLFERYLADRFGGDTYTHGMETSGVVGAQNLQTVTGESAGNLLDDFALAMAANTMGIASSDRRFVFGSLGLTQTYVDQFGDSKTLGGAYAAPVSGGSASVKAPIGGFTFVAVPSVPSSGLPVTITDQGSVPGFGLAGGLAQH